MSNSNILNDLAEALRIVQLKHQQVHPQVGAKQPIAEELKVSLDNAETVEEVGFAALATLKEIIDAKAREEKRQAELKSNFAEEHEKFKASCKSKDDALKAKGIGVAHGFGYCPPQKP